MNYRVDYEPAESSTGLFGGNSNWRGPIWFPVNYLLIESLQKFHFFLGDNYKVECPTGSGRMMNPLGSRRRNLPTADAYLSGAMKMAADRFSAARRNFRTILIGAISSRFTNTSMAITAPASAPAIKPAGPPWWRN